MTDERARIVNKTFDEIDDALGKLLGLTRAEMQIASSVKWARKTLSELDDQREDERDRLEAEVNRWHAEAVGAQAKLKDWEALAREKNWGHIHDERADRMASALQQITWLADAAEPLSVKAAMIAREAMERRQPRAAQGEG